MEPRDEDTVRRDAVVEDIISSVLVRLGAVVSSRGMMSSAGGRLRGCSHPSRGPVSDRDQHDIRITYRPFSEGVALL